MLSALTLATGCSAADFGGQSGRSGGKAKARTGQNAAKGAGDDKASVDPSRDGKEPQAIFDVSRADLRIFENDAEFSSMTPQRFFDIVTRQVGDEPFEVAGYTFFDLRMRLEDSHEAILALQDEYPTMGDLIASRESDAGDLTGETIAALAENADMVLNGDGAGLQLLGTCGALDSAQRVCSQAEGLSSAGCAWAFKTQNPYLEGGACGLAGLAYLCDWGTQIAIGARCTDDKKTPSAPPQPGQQQPQAPPQDPDEGASDQVEPSEDPDAG